MDQDILNYKTELWRLEALLDKHKVERAKGNGAVFLTMKDTIASLEWAVRTLQVPPNFEEQLAKAQQEAELANEELQQLKVEELQRDA